jgi:hypothetical protein
MTWRQEARLLGIYNYVARGGRQRFAHVGDVVQVPF